MEGLIVLDTEDGGAGDNKTKGGKTAKGSVIGITSRKRLADISNLQQLRPKPEIQQVKQQFDSLTNKEYVDNLQKENRTLMKILADRNKIIELSRVQLQNLRVNLQKVQQQNLQLAQENSHMLGELNSGKDRLKALQHELGCKNGLLKVRKLEAEAERITCQNTENKVDSTKCVEAGESLQADKWNGTCNTKRERQPNNLAVDTPTVEAVQVKEKADNKRRLRRQSARFKTEEQEATTKEVFETSREKFPVSSLCDNLDHESSLTCSLVEKEDPTIEAVQAKEKAKKKRRLTRQSSRFKTEKREATEDLFETNGEKFPVSSLCDNVVHGSRPTCSLVEKEDPTIEAVQAKEKAKNKRRLTRQSSRFKTEEREGTEDLFETNGDKIPVSALCDDAVHESGPTCSSVKKEEQGNASQTSGGQECRRSFVRPLRRAAEKIKSYKEIPINVKMRRDF